MPVTPMVLVSHLVLSLSGLVTLSLILVMLLRTLLVMLWFEVVLLLLLLPLTMVDRQAVLVLFGLATEPQYSGKGRRFPCSI